MTSIYKLIDPRDKSVRYVGASRNPERRYGPAPICLRGRGNPALLAWEKELAAVGRCIVLEIIEVVSDEQRIDRERFWIRQYSATSPLLCNIQETLAGSGRTDKCDVVKSVVLSQKEWDLLDRILEDNRCFRSRNDLIRRCIHFGIKAFLLANVQPTDLEIALKEARPELLIADRLPDLLEEAGR